MRPVSRITLTANKPLHCTAGWPHGSRAPAGDVVGQLVANGHAARIFARAFPAQPSQLPARPQTSAPNP
jgi:hypothetical protein